MEYGEYFLSNHEPNSEIEIGCFRCDVCGKDSNDAGILINLKNFNGKIKPFKTNKSYSICPRCLLEKLGVEP